MSVRDRPRLLLASLLVASLVLPSLAFAAPPEGRGGGNDKGVKKGVLYAEIEPGSDTGEMQISGGKAPYSVRMITDAGSHEVYSGSDSTIEVPLLAGENDFLVTDSKRGSFETSGLSTTKFWVASPASRMLYLYDPAADNGEGAIIASVHVPGDPVPSTVALRNIAYRQADGHLFVVFSDESRLGNARPADRSR